MLVAKGVHPPLPFAGGRTGPRSVLERTGARACRNSGLWGAPSSVLLEETSIPKILCRFFYREFGFWAEELSRSGG